MAQTASPLSLVPDDGASVVAAAAYAGGRRVANIAIADARSWSRRPGHVVWIGLLEPSEVLLRQVQSQFGLHGLAIEDARNAHQRPKLEQYGESLFIVARTAEMVDGRIVFGETHLFVGRGYVVSVRHGASMSYTPCASGAKHARPPDPRRGLHPLCHPRLRRRQLQAGPRVGPGGRWRSMEDRVVADDPQPPEIERLYKLRRDLLRLRKPSPPSSRSAAVSNMPSSR